jgi:hypothetical protein
MPRLTLALLLVAIRAVPLPADEPVRPTAVMKLFDGKSLADCYTFLHDTKYEDSRKVFRVTDGLLHVTGEGMGSLITNKEYRDYHLVLEFKWGEKVYPPRTEKTKDSGLLIHSRGADGGYQGIWMPSIEVQIIEGGMGDYILVTGAGKDGQPAPISLTCETDRDRDGEVVWKAGGKRETFNTNSNPK